jgi:predicted nucleotidyltransferase
VPGIYWLAVVLISVVGTLFSDNLVDNLGVELQTTTIASAAASGWRLCEPWPGRTEAMHTPRIAPAGAPTSGWRFPPGAPGDPRCQRPLRFRPMQPIDESLIVEAGRRIATAAPGAEVILFGSHARGEAHPHSDVDFLVVEPSVEDEAGESVRLRRALRDLRLPTDIIVVSRRYAEDWTDVHGSVVHAAFSQGRVLAG